MHLFFATHRAGNNIELDPEESRHLAKVLRLREGDQVQAMDGKGNIFTCSIADANQKKAQLNIITQDSKEEYFGVHLAVAPTKNINRWEWFLEKATEIGIDEISPIITSQSERKVVKADRNNRILISAVKQSQKANLPKLGNLSSFKDFINIDFEGEKFIAHCNSKFERIALKEIHQVGKNALVLIGPEGDFNEEEIQLALSKGFKSVLLSESRLRTETAAIVACHTLNLCNA